MFLTVRKYAPFFQWANRPTAELGVVQELIAALNAKGLRQLTAPSSFSPDPPDCMCRNEKNSLVAVEVTEVICENAARQVAKGNDVYREWCAGELNARIACQLAEKDSKTYHGGPYAEILVCIFTAESALTDERVHHELAGASFGPFSNLTGAYLLLSYDPSTQSYPIHVIRFKRASRAA